MVIKGRNTFIAILAMHGVLENIGLADPTILGLFSLLVVVRAHLFAGVRCIVQVLVELRVDAIGFGSGVAIVQTNYSTRQEYNCCRYADRGGQVGRKEEAELRDKDRK